jgi:hypothetical protein
MVWRFVEGLDLTVLLAGIKALEGRPGHPPADPRILLGVRHRTGRIARFAARKENMAMLLSP